MNSPEERWWAVRAGEYVLGTLRGEDLALFEKILAHDTTMQAEVASWERRLTGLNETTPALVPGEHVWPQIRERIRHLDTAHTTSHEDALSTTTLVPAEPTVKRQRVIADRWSFWPTIASLATAASIVFGVLFWQGYEGGPMRVDGLAVILSDESGDPYFLIETDYDNLRVRVTALSPPSLDAARNFQLWQALPDRSSVRPVALLPRESGASRIFHVESLIEGSDLFGVSAEPIGAATDDGPTSPAFAHGDFFLKHDEI